MDVARPFYETAIDRERERAIADEAARCWHCQMIKTKIAFAADYCAMRQRSVVALVEVKDRRYPIDRLDAMGGLMVSLHKWSLLAHLSKVSRLPLVVLLQATDGLFFHSTSKFGHDGVGYMGRVDRGDWQDVEPVVLLRARRFKRIGSVDDNGTGLPLFDAGC